MKSIITLLGLGLLSTSLYAADTQVAPTSMEPIMNTQNSASPAAAAGTAYLNANKQKEGVVTLPSGLQYKIIKAGTGATPTANDTVSVNYEGKLIDGTKFDSSYDRGQPISFKVTQVIPGWVEALQLMKVGSTWELYIPSNLAYGEQGAPPTIGPNQVLVFKVELLGVQKG